MAIVFELVVNFGANDTAMSNASNVLREIHSVEVRGEKVLLSGPYVTRLSGPNGYIEFSVVVPGLGVSGPGPGPSFDPQTVTADELKCVGDELYGMLRRFRGYRAAAVGWDPECLVDIQDLDADWHNGDPPAYHGLVLEQDLCTKWSLGPEWVDFEPGYRWLPFRGSRPIWDTN